MSAFTSKAAGNWSSGGQTTWNEVGVPGAGDTVTITHAITVDTNTTVGVNGSTSLTFSATLTVATSVTFTVQGNTIQGDANFILSAGAGLVFATASGNVKWLFGDANNFTVYANCILVANGTSGSHCTVSKTGGNSAWFDDFGENGGSCAGKIAFDCTYTDFTGISSADNTWSIPFNDFGQKDFRFDHCTFDTCGPVGTSRPFGWGGGGSKDCYFRDCVWSNSPGAHSVNALLGNTSPASPEDQEFARCWFDQKFQVNGVYYLYDCAFYHGLNPLGNGPLSNIGNLFRTANGDDDITAPTGADRFYWIGALDHPSNPHCLSSIGSGKVIEQGVFECPPTAGSGECVYVSAGDITVRNNLAIPCTDGTSIGAMANNPETAGPIQWTVTHNTVVGTSTPHICISEADPAGTPQYASVKSNLVVDPSGSTAQILTDIGSNFDDPVLGTNATHNGQFGQGSFVDPLCGQTLQGYRANFTSAPGANDVIASPNFVDPGRNFAAWAVYKGAANQTDSLAVKTAAAEALIKADRTLTRTDLLVWVRAGFAPQNPVLRNAGHDGVTIGAVEALIPVLPFTLIPTSGRRVILAAR